MVVYLYVYHIVDYVVPEGNNGCQGGNMYNSFMYIIFNDGINSEKSYKYQGMVNYIFVRAQFKKPMGKCFAQIIRCHLSYL